MEVVFLGTSCMTPTKERNHQAFFIKHGSEGILVDCGEGTQRQFKFAGIPLTKITKILISHWHGDHVFGLPGVIQSISAAEGTKKIKVYGPKGTKRRFRDMMVAFPFDREIILEINDISQELFFENDLISLSAFSLDHNIDCVGYQITEKDRRRINTAYIEKLKIPDGPLLGKLQENKEITWNGQKIYPEKATRIIKGKKIGIIPDTKLCNNCYKLANGVDLLICESTYSHKLIKKAKKYFHLTAKEAALIANEANVKRLILTHFSNRYKDTHELEEEARVFFDKTTCAKDLMKIQL